MEIVGRNRYKNILRQYVESDSPEFVAVYGRRRVGKTFLIKEYFNQSFSFYISGLSKSNKAENLENFNATLIAYGKTHCVWSVTPSSRFVCNTLRKSGKNLAFRAW